MCIETIFIGLWLLTIPQGVNSKFPIFLMRYRQAIITQQACKYKAGPHVYALLVTLDADLAGNMLHLVTAAQQKRA
jgi:hypothetical protein